MITDEMLRVAARESLEDYVNSLERDYDPNHPHQFSKAFEKKINKLKRRANHPFSYRVLRRVASVVLAILVGGSVWLTVDLEARAAFIGWIKDICGTFFTYQYSDNIDANADQTKYRPGWVPKDYSEVFSDDDDSGGNVLYENASGGYLQFSYIIKQSESSLFIDNENITKYTISINGNPADYLKSSTIEKSDSIVWINEKEHLFYLAGFLEQDELVKIAESVEIIK